MNIITGYEGVAHITAAQDGAINAGIIGSGNYVLPVGSELHANVISANSIEIEDGILVMNGRAASIEHGTSEYLTISNGSQGMYRTDLIVATYEMHQDTTESITLEVIEGTPSAGTPATPSYTSADILTGATVAQFPLYKVNIDGITISSIETLFAVAESSEDQTADISIIKSKLNGVGNDGVRFFKNQIGANNSMTITSSGATRYIVIVNGAVATAKSINVVDSNSSGVIHQAIALAGSNITYTNTTNKLTVNNGSTYGSFILVMQYHGPDIELA